MASANYRAVNTADLQINYNEVALRLGTERGYTDENIESCFTELKKVITAKFSFVEVPVNYKDDCTIDLSFTEVRSETLYKNLKLAPKAYVFACTLGSGVDRYLMRLSLTSQAKYFISDALASAMAEALADYVDDYLREGKDCRPRFSPGFGDLPLDIQPKVLDAVNATKLLGITLGKSLLMAPMKSVTAIMGINSD